MSGFDLGPEARRRVARAVSTGEAVADPALAAAAVMLARSAQARLRARTLRSALRISAATTAVWLVLVVLPVTLNAGVYWTALAAGLGVGVVLFLAILLVGWRQLRLARRAEARNQRLLDPGPGTPDPAADR
ncbi:MAG TPA: hypothetical protein VG276_14195 [Actinomycetes bacterium]|jgi:hypothetical protein|nr:hypothetical protein [Actinomycetes bacterium]